jgi:hypothetical protein
MFIVLDGKNVAIIYLLHSLFIPTSKKITIDDNWFESPRTQLSTSTLLSNTEVQKNENKSLFETTIPVVGSKGSFDIGFIIHK